MTSRLVGYDPERIDALHRLLRRAALELTHLVADPDCAAVVGEVGRALHDRCLPAVIACTRCDALTRGWSWSTTSTWTVTSAHPPAELADAWRQAARRVNAGDATASAELHRRAGDVRALARAIGHPDDHQIAVLVDHLPPIVVALMLGEFGLDDRRLAHWVLELQRREFAALGAGSTYDERGVANVADVTTALLALRPHAAMSWAQVAVAEHGILFRAADQRAEQRALLAALTPGQVDARAAGELLAGLLRRLAATGGILEQGSASSPTWRAFAGEAASLWFVELTTGHGRFGWPGPDHERTDLVRWMATDARARDHLDRAERRALFDLLGGPMLDAERHLDLAAVERLAESSSAYRHARRSAVVEVADRRRDGADLLVGIGSAGVSHLTGGVGSLVTGVATALGGERTRTWLADRGWYPTDPDDVDDAEHRRQVAHAATLQELVVTAAANELVAAGRLPASALDGLHSDRASACSGTPDLWLREALLDIGRTHPDEAAELLAALGAFAGHTERCGTT